PTIHRDPPQNKDPKMASPEQIAANRRNAQKSTGPKDTSQTRFNGMKHGLCSPHVALPGEDPAQFDAWRGALHGEWQPVTFTRALLVDRMAIAAWKMTRATRMERAWTYEVAADVGQGV